MALQITVESEAFPEGTVANGKQNIITSWDEILWAAVTVGRPNRNFVFRHGDASRYEALFRWSLIRMAIEQSGPAAVRLRRTTAAKTLDPTEKGAVSYFLGMTFCKLLAARLLNTPWVLHLDVFRPVLNPVLTGRSRPDLVGLESGGNRWHSFESKGRISSPDSVSKGKAKEQAQRLISVNGTACSLHIGAVTYFQNDVLQFYWRDPNPDAKSEIQFDLGDNPWLFYYSAIAELISELNGWSVLLGNRGKSSDTTENKDLIFVREVEVSVGVHPEIAQLLQKQEWSAAHNTAVKKAKELVNEGYKPDGIRIQTGESWKQQFNESSMKQS